MYIMILFAIVSTGDLDQAFVPITRSEVGYYMSREACEADVKSQGTKFLGGLNKLEVAMFASKCVMVKGPEGTPA